MQRTGHIYVATYVTQKYALRRHRQRIELDKHIGQKWDSQHTGIIDHRNQTGIHIAEAYSAQNRYHAEMVSVQT